VHIAPFSAPSGAAQLLAAAPVAVWAEHASHKVFRAAQPPTGPLPPAAGPAHVACPGLMQGATTAVQLVLHTSQAVTCSVGWVAGEALTAGLVLSVNISAPSGAYGSVGLHPDPIVPLAAGAPFVVPAGVAQPIYIKLTAAAAALTITCGDDAPIHIALTAEVRPGEDGERELISGVSG
jgi:hypothetical protein